MRKYLLLLIIAVVCILAGCTKGLDNTASNEPEGETESESSDIFYNSFYPSVDEHHVYFGAGVGSFFALDKETGQLVWKIPSLSDWVYTTTVASDGVVAYRDDGYLIGVDAMNGQQLWKLHEDPSFPDITEDGVLYYSGISPTTNTEIIKGINISSGQVIWEYKAAESIFSKPYLKDGMLYIGGDTFVYGYDINEQQYWKYQINIQENKAFGLIDEMPVVTERNVVFGTGGFIYAIDPHNQQLKWKYETDSRAGNYNLVATQDQIFLGDLNKIISLDDADGGLLWEFTAAGINAPPLFAEGKLYFGSGNYLYALNASNGEVIWKYKANGEVGVKPAISMV